MARIGTDLARHLARDLGLDLASASLAAEVRGLGAIAHFDPSVGATDNGTTSTWIDRIGGYTVASTSQATRMTYSASVAGLNNRPGWTGVAASSTKLVGADGLAALIDEAAPHTIYIVAKRADTAATFNALLSVGSTTLQNLHYLWQTQTTCAMHYSRFEAGASTAHTGLVQALATAHVSSVTYTGAAVSLHTNASTNVVSAANTRAGVCDRFVIGAQIYAGVYGQHYGGDIGDIIIFPTAHTAAQRMYVERLIAAKYGWPVLRGLSGFSAANYLACAGTTTGIRGDDTNGVWSDVLIRADVLPTLNPANVAGAYGSNTGYGMITAVAGLTATAYNGTTGSVGPTYTQLAADVGKLQIWGTSAGPANLVRTFRQGAEVGAGTALTGFSKNSVTAYSVGARAAANPASQYTIFGVAGGDLEQVAANQAARAAAIKAAQKFVAHSGVAASNGWAFDSVKSSYPSISGPDALALTGTLTAAQIIVPTWPW